MARTPQMPRTGLSTQGTGTQDDSRMAYLRSHGWKRVLVGNPWQWHKPPLPARYTLHDAYDLERSRSK